jgi:hypothetical protein
MKREVRHILPEYNFQKIENEHKLYHCFYDLAGVPRITTWNPFPYMGFLSPSAHLQGIPIDGKLGLIFGENLALMTSNRIIYDFDYLATKAFLRFLTNVVVYGLTHSGISDKSRYIPVREIQELAEKMPKNPPVIPPPTPNSRP